MAEGLQQQTGSPGSERNKMSSANKRDLHDESEDHQGLSNPVSLESIQKTSCTGEETQDSQENEIDEENESKTDKSAVPFYKYLTNPLMLLLDDTPGKGNDIIDEIVNDLNTENREAKNKNSPGSTPAILQGCGRGLKETIEHIENLLQFENYEPDPNEISDLVPANLHEIDNTAGLSIIGHSLGAYVSVLESAHLKHLATRIVTDSSMWISKIFRYSESAAHFHEEEKEGVVKICQLAIHKKFPKYSSDGYEALYSRPPVIYVSSSAKHNLGQHICHQIGLPLNSLCIVPCRLGRMDLQALKKLIEDDVAAGRTPTIVVAYAGTPLLGRCDDLNELHEISRLHDIWLHLEGSSLSMLSFTPIPDHMASATLCNSMTLNMAAWLALPSLPFVTLFRSPDVVLTRLVGLSTFNVRFKLNCISLWLCILSLGYNKTIARLQFHAHLARTIYDRLKAVQLKNELVVLDLESPCVILKYQMKTDPSSEPKHERDSGESKSPFAPRDAYCDTLNIWLTDMLKSTVPEVHVSAVEVDGVGMCVRYAPLETSVAVNSWSLLDVTRDDIEQFLDCLEQHIRIVDATVMMKSDFQEIVTEQDNLRLVHLQTWAGLGAVRYIPDAWLASADSLSEEGRNEVNSLNQQIVQRLKSSDSAFSLGVTESDVFCIRFGLVTQDSDLEELIAVVLTTGREVEESSKFLETMADAVKKGIEKAAEDLEKENRDKLLQEGLLRQVPLVSSLINWWSPPPKDTIKGRTFNLNSGKMASTEETYKSCMQVLESPISVDPSGPPRDVPLKFSLKRSKKSASAIISGAESDQIINSCNTNKPDHTTEITEQKTASDPINFDAQSSEIRKKEELSNGMENIPAVVK